MTEHSETHKTANNLPMFGVGLRHPHYADALNVKIDSTDFVEIHAENFFALGGKLVDYLSAVSEVYPISVHGTAMGLGSASGIPESYLSAFCELVERINPLHVSDHASFSWGTVNKQPVHSGDLLPLHFDKAHLAILVQNVDRVQQRLGRKLLVENIVSYLNHHSDPLKECDFLSELAARTQCGLLIDINNLIINLQNFPTNKESSVAASHYWLSQLPAHAVEEIHLAGSQKPKVGQLIVDDHSQPVSDEGWQLYHYTARLFPHASTLIEWDNELPSWQRLNLEASRARALHPVSQAP